MGLACSQSAEWLWVLRVGSLCLKGSQVGRLLMWKCLVLFPCCRMCQLLSTENDCNLAETPGGTRLLNLQGHACSFKSRSSNKIQEATAICITLWPRTLIKVKAVCRLRKRCQIKLHLGVERRLRECVECRAMKPSD